MNATLEKIAMALVDENAEQAKQIQQLQNQMNDFDILISELFEENLKLKNDLN